MEKRAFLKATVGGAAALPILLASKAALAETLGPVLAVVSHPVKDYAAWRAVYDSVESLRQKHNVTGAEVFHDPKDANMMVIIHRFPTLEAMQGFLGDPALKDAMAKGGVTAPPTALVGIAV